MYLSGTLAEALRDMQSGVYDFTKDGECSNCGACCTDLLPVSDEELREIRRYVRKHGIRCHSHAGPFAEPVLDLTCPFRNEAERKCDIYPVRPAICRDFRCDKPAKRIEHDKALYHGMYGVVRMREAVFGDDCIAFFGKTCEEYGKARKDGAT